MEPATMIAVAQAGAQLYSMFRSGDKGIGKVLAAQTQMLVEISKQLGVIDEKLDAVYRALGDLHNAVRQAPRENALKLIETTLKGSFVQVDELLRVRAKYERKRGMVYAVAKVESEAHTIAERLFNLRASLISDGGVTLCPFVAAAWFVELQLRGSCMPFDEERVEGVARTYRDAFALWQRDVILPELKSLNEAAAAMEKAIQASRRYDDHDCWHSVALEAKQCGAGGGPIIGRETWYEYAVTGTRSQISAVTSPVCASLDAYRYELEFLTDAGIHIGRPFFTVEPLFWTAKEAPTRKEFGKDRRSADAYLGVLKKKACKEKPGFGTNLRRNENQHEAKVEALLARVVVYGHFSLICREVQASAQALLERVTDR